ncbi:hypothetical protein EMCG_09313 [[Emmonsia] crescens]|uniref:Uncharacterized protein n=1 Tax=[Emmonsia] crescens TaxID=73230 RepID=A0A0G2I2E8_9EURO|nr:hypothetical protein EMCG_09313 [Emmonsia crescens UAMH 3008]
MHPPHDHVPMEARPHSTHKTDKHLLDMRPVEELLPVLYARSLLRPAHRRSRRCPEDGGAWTAKLDKQRILRAGTREGDRGGERGCGGICEDG